jgi:ElaB/YqjD/DUF883 family membrane-anchored ribosome-binding protein
VVYLTERKELEEIKTTIDEKLNKLTRDVDTRLREIRDQMPELQKKTAEIVAERPLLALGVAFVLGMTLGLAMSRSRD